MLTLLTLVPLVGGLAACSAFQAYPLIPDKTLSATPEVLDPHAARDRLWEELATVQEPLGEKWFEGRNRFADACDDGSLYYQAGSMYNGDRQDFLFMAKSVAERWRALGLETQRYSFSPQDAIYEVRFSHGDVLRVNSLGDKLTVEGETACLPVSLKVQNRIDDQTYDVTTRKYDP